MTQLFFGPSDFSACLGTERADPRVAAAAREVARIARAAGREAGSSPSRRRLRRARGHGLHPRPRRLRHRGPRARRSTPVSPPPARELGRGKGELAADPRGLILEAYRMQIGPEDCRTMFLDWALGLPEGAGAAETAELLAHYGARQPDHPMTAMLREGLREAPPPRRRGRTARLRPPEEG